LHLSASVGTYETEEMTGGERVDAAIRSRSLN
jgi:hypothetical protein